MFAPLGPSYNHGWALLSTTRFLVLQGVHH